jgi:protein O-GlcNAc transferase
MNEFMLEPNSITAPGFTIDQALQAAIAHHQAGDLTQAERFYRSILKAIPAHPDANHNLGVLAIQFGRPIEALPYLKTALDAVPSNAQYWLSYAEGMVQAGLRAEARNLLRTGRSHGLNGPGVDALEQRIGDAENEPSLEKLDRYTPEVLAELFGEGKFSELKLAAARLIDRNPRDATPRKALAAVFRKEGNLPGALEVLLRAAELVQDDAGVHYNLGIVRDEL